VVGEVEVVVRDGAGTSGSKGGKVERNETPILPLLLVSLLRQCFYDLRE
jgi:hypothetical protein